jgi:hypothetical protein
VLHESVCWCVALLAITGLATAGQVEVQVGYADDIRPSPFFPVPWSGGANVALFAGTGSPQDSGAIRIINNGPGDFTILSLTVDGFGNGDVAALWSSFFPFVLHAGQSAIFEQTSTGNNFDSSDWQGGGPSTAIPVVHLTTSLGVQNLPDTAQVLNTEGTDHLAAAGLNESHQWRDIGTTGGQAGTPEPASLTLLGIGIAGMAGYSWRRKKQQA